MCPIDLHNDIHTQHGFIAMHQMPKLKLNNQISVFVADYSKFSTKTAVLSQIMVSRRYNESRSTLIWLVKRVYIIGTAIDHQRSGLLRVTSVRQDIVLRQRH